VCPLKIYKTSLLLLVIILYGVKDSCAQTFQWAKRWGGLEHEAGRQVAVDASGNVYTIGVFQATADFDPGAGVSNLTSAGQEDIFLTKLNSAGNFVWARRYGSTVADVAGYVACDAAGNVYITGGFSGTVDFDPGAGIFNMTALGGQDIFVCKISSAGNFIWAKQAGSSTFGDRGESLVIDASSNVYITGPFGGTADFDPGAGTFNMVSAGSFDIFLWKLNTSGNLVWAKRMGSTSLDQGTALALDVSGNVYATGSFFNTVDFDPNAGVVNLTPAIGNGAFVVKISSAGNLIWAKVVGNLGYDVAVDPLGNVYTCGQFSGTVDFDPGAGTFNLTAVGTNYNIYICKLTTTGNFVWARRIGATGSIQYAEGIKVDGAGNSYIAGYFSGTVDFNPGTGVNNLTSATSTGTFILKLTNGGNYVWAGAIAGSGHVHALGMCIDAARNIYYTGQFYASADFNPFSGTSNLSSTDPNSPDIYVVKLNFPSPLPIELLSFDAAPNKNTIDLTWATATETNNDFFTIEKSKDGNEFEDVAKVDGAGNSNQVIEYSFTDKNPYNGLSYYRLKQTDFNGEFSYSKTVAVNLNPNNQFYLYQNPSANHIIVAFKNAETQPCKLLIHDVTGRMVHEQQITSATTILNFAFLPGVYVASVKYSQQAFSQKFIVR